MDVSLRVLWTTTFRLNAKCILGAYILSGENVFSFHLCKNSWLRGVMTALFSSLDLSFPPAIVYRESELSARWPRITQMRCLPSLNIYSSGEEARQLHELQSVQSPKATLSKRSCDRLNILLYPSLFLILLNKGLPYNIFIFAASPALCDTLWPITEWGTETDVKQVTRYCNEIITGLGRCSRGCKWDADVIDNMRGTNLRSLKTWI